MSDSDRGRGYEYEPEEDDDYYTYDATDEDDEGRRRPLVMLAIVALIVVFAGVVFFAYKQGLKQGAQGNPPVIRADDSPTKVAPTNPGGIEIPHQDKTVYDRISGDKSSGAEHLLPSPEEPMAVKPAPAHPAAPSSPTPSAPVGPSISPAPSGDVSQQALPPTSMGNQPGIESAPAAPVEAAPSAASTAGGYVVQLAAFRDEASARAEFRKLQKKYTALAGLSADIQRADLGAKGIYYRLRGGYMDKAKASDLCASLKAQGQACLVKPR